MANRGQVAASVRANKDRHPERYCSAKGCLWAVRSGRCPKHPYAAIHLGRIAAGDDELTVMPEIEEVSING